EPIGSFVGVPLVSNNVCFGVISAVRGDKNGFGPGDAGRLGLLAGVWAPPLGVGRVRRGGGGGPLDRGVESCRLRLGAARGARCRWRCATSIASSRSTINLATPPATRCCGAWRASWRR